MTYHCRLDLTYRPDNIIYLTWKEKRLRLFSFQTISKEPKERAEIIYATTPSGAIYCNVDFDTTPWNCLRCSKSDKDSFLVFGTHVFPLKVYIIQMEPRIEPNRYSHSEGVVIFESFENMCAFLWHPISTFYCVLMLLDQLACFTMFRLPSRLDSQSSVNLNMSNSDVWVLFAQHSVL